MRHAPALLTTGAATPPTVTGNRLKIGAISGDMSNRIARIETKLTRLLIHMGLDSEGLALPDDRAQQEGGGYG